MHASIIQITRIRNVCYINLNMTKHTQLELLCLRESLHLSFDALGYLFKVPSRTVRYWESGVNARGNLISKDVIDGVLLRLKQFESCIENNVASVQPTDIHTLKVFFDNEAYRLSSEWDDQLPLAALHRVQQQ